MYVQPYSWAKKTQGQQHRQAARLKESAKQLLFWFGQWSSDSSCSATDGSFDIGLGKTLGIGEFPSLDQSAPVYLYWPPGPFLSHDKRQLRQDEGFCDSRARVEDRPLNRLGQIKAQVIDYEQRWGARKIKEYLHIKRERANRQLMNRNGGLAISRVWQHVIWRTIVLTLVWVSIFSKFGSVPLQFECFSISFPYRLALSHCHGLFFRYLTWSVSFFLLWFSIWGRGTQLSRNVMGKKWNQIVGIKRIFCFLSCLNCLLSWDKNLINHDFHRQRLREVKFTLSWRPSTIRSQVGPSSRLASTHTCQRPEVYTIQVCYKVLPVRNIRLRAGNKASEVLQSSIWLQVGSKRNRKRQAKRSNLKHKTYFKERIAGKLKRERGLSERCNHFSINLWTPFVYPRTLRARSTEFLSPSFSLPWVLLWRASAILGSQGKQKEKPRYPFHIARTLTLTVMRQQTRSCTCCTNKFTNKISPLLTFRWQSWEQIFSPAAKSSFSGNLVDILVIDWSGGELIKQWHDWWDHSCLTNHVIDILVVRFISIPASIAGADKTVRIASSAIAIVVGQSTSGLVSSKNLAKDHVCHPENAQYHFNGPYSPKGKKWRPLAPGGIMPR